MAWRGLILRRRKLGRTSVREICKLSSTGLVGLRNDRPVPKTPFDITIRWGCTDNAPTKLILNSAAAIGVVNDKAKFRGYLNAAEMGPPAWYAIDADVAKYPCVVRPKHHAQGRMLFVCENAQDVREAARRCGEGWYAAPLFNKTHEFRVAVVQGRVAWVAKKTPGNPGDVAWNVARGGRFDNVGFGDWPLKVVRLAVDAMNLTDLDFGGVDVMWKADPKKGGEARVLEINSAPSLTSPYRQICMAKCFDWIMNNESKEKIKLIEEKGGWRKFIHPAVADEALLVT